MIDTQLEKKQLGQLRPANTTAASIYASSSAQLAEVNTIVVCNTTASTAKYRIFYDVDGTTYSEATALFYDVTLAANSTDLIEIVLPITGSSANLAVRTDTANAINFTVFGREKIL